MSLSTTEKKVLSRLEKKLDKALKKQAQNALSEIFSEAGCGAIAKEIKAGRNVTGNAEFGIRLCIHNKIAPRVDPATLEFTPMSKRGKQLEKGFIKTTNLLLDNAGFPKMNPKLYDRLQKKDKEFERDIAKRRKERKR